MALDETKETTIMPPQGKHRGEVCMVHQERWAEIRRLRQDKRVSISEIGRRLEVDRKTIRRDERRTAQRREGLTFASLKYPVSILTVRGTWPVWVSTCVSIGLAAACHSLHR